MTEGTKSILLGCHSILHSFWIWVAWRKIYGKYPNWWQTLCILLHDVGYAGKNYLTEKNNDGHELAGAKIALRLLAPIDIVIAAKAYLTIIGHRSNNHIRSKLEMPDDYSWIIAPMWWLRWNHRIEKFKINDPAVWKHAVMEKFNKGEKYSSFLLFKKLTQEKEAEDETCQTEP